MTEEKLKINEKKQELEAPPDLVDEYVLHLPRPLNLEEKKYLLAVERGDLRNVRRLLQAANKPSTNGNKAIDVNCVDSLGRGALTLAIEGENLEMVELLTVMGVETRDALLHAINQEFVEAVELLLEHEELLSHNEVQERDQKITYSWQRVDPVSARYSPDITPLVLAAQRNNYEILKLLLDRGAALPMPHDVTCSCEDCLRSSAEDPLKVSSTRISEYKALASPSLISLSSSDPLLTAFQLSWELKELASAEPESKMEYWKLRRQVEKFAVDLLHQARSTTELKTILNYDPEEKGKVPKRQLAKLEQAIQYKQKRFVAHPHIQQLLAAIWYEGVPGFRRMSHLQKSWIIIKTALLFPFYCLIYFFAPESKTGRLLQRPFMKFLVHASSYLFFLLILILVSQRAEEEVFKLFGDDNKIRHLEEDKARQRGNPPTPLEGIVILYVLGFIWEETREVYVEGLKSYLRNLWNFIDFTRNSFYVATGVLRVAAYLQQRAEIEMDSSAAMIPREKWGAYDPQLIAEGLFAAANIFSALKLVHIFSINPHLGPLQISLGRMVIDIVKFFFIYTLVLFAFACGLNQLLWYFAELEKQKCYSGIDDPSWDSSSDSCIRWRRFSSLFESCQSLFWASFGEVGIETFELAGIKAYTRFWGLLMFGSYCVINVIVLLNLLIAMMSNSYAVIEEDADTEWKFARSKLLLCYFEEGRTLPPPFNIFPPPKWIFRFCGFQKKSESKRSAIRHRAQEYKYEGVMRALIWRYVVHSYSERQSQPASEDDVHELKSDISSWRCEFLNILSRNGMDIAGANKKNKTAKKMKVWERQLLQDFQVAGPKGAPDEIVLEELALRQAPEGEDNISRWQRVAKLAVHKSADRRWHNVLDDVVKNSQIGKSNSKSAIRNQASLKYVIEEARRLVSTSPLPPVSPIKLPKSPATTILQILKDDEASRIFRPETPNSTVCSDCESEIQKFSPATVNYLDEKHRRSPQSPVPPRKTSPHVVKRKSPAACYPQNYPSMMSTLPINHRSTDYEGPNDNIIVRPKPKFASSPIKVPEIEIIPGTPEFRAKSNNFNRVTKIAPKSPRISSSRSPRKGWL